MVEMITFAAEVRAIAGKGPARALRRAGRVPAVVYGERKEQEMVSLEARALRRQLANPHFFNTLCSLQVNGEAVRVLPRDVQLHPVTDDPIHADFVRVSAGATVEVEIPVVFVNEDTSPGLKRGGVLNIVRREVELVCPADAIPGELTVDLAAFDIGDSVHISHVVLPEGARPTITDRDFTIATISAPTVVAEEAEAAQAAAEEEKEREAEAEAPTEGSSE
ncbi:MAG TPA: 50S ribosomal protein L25/general stress protein Ctc [Geminicoccaceae bacterium]|nr:50S ribosomal protein L25/general stress protein Ctc [Geminicoccaceae bacterium]